MRGSAVVTAPLFLLAGRRWPPEQTAVLLIVFLFSVQCSAPVSLLAKITSNTAPLMRSNSNMAVGMNEYFYNSPKSDSGWIEDYQIFVKVHWV